MKKILAILLVLFVSVTLFVACGEKKDDTVNEPEKTEATENKTENTTEKTEPVVTDPNAKMFENKLISFELPEGYTAKDEGMTINVSNAEDPLKAIVVTILENNPAPIEEVAKQTAEMLKDSKQENVKIGNYDYIKLTTPLMGIELVTLMISQNNNIYSMTVNGFEDPGIQKIINSITIK